MSVRKKSVKSTTATADNSAATVTVSDVPKLSIFIAHISASYSAATIGLLTLKDGSTTIGNYHVHNQRDIVFDHPLEIEGAAEVSLAASGTAGVIGAVTVDYYAG